MCNLLKIIISLLYSSFLIYSFKIYGKNFSLGNNKNNLNFNSKHCKHSYEYTTVEKQPTVEEDGTKLYICKYCRKKYSKIIPKLNKENYIIENITSNEMALDIYQNYMENMR